MVSVEKVFALLSDDQKRLVQDFDVRFRSAEKHKGYVHALSELIALGERATGEGKKIDVKIRKQVLRAIDGLRDEVLSEFVFLRKDLVVDKEMTAAFGEHVREHGAHMKAVQFRLPGEFSSEEGAAVMRVAEDIEEALKKQEVIIEGEKDVFQKEMDALVRLKQEFEKEHPNKEELKSLSAVLSDSVHKLNKWLLTEKEACVDRLQVLLKKYPPLIESLERRVVSSVELKDVLSRVTRMDEVEQLNVVVLANKGRFSSDALELLAQKKGEIQKLSEKRRGLLRWFVPFRWMRGEVRKLEEEVAKQKGFAEEDSLTGLLTRRVFGEVLNKLVNQNRLFCLAMLDLDEFKKVNDKFGHLAGDAVLRGTGEVIKQLIREGDYAFRYGGEELAIILNGVGITKAQEICERLRLAISARKYLVGEEGMQVELRVTVSIGVMEFSKSLTSIGLVTATDSLLYVAKRQGRDRVVVSDVIAVENQQV